MKGFKTMKFQRVREKLRAMRKEAKLSLHKLALISGFNENTIKGYETIASISSNYVYFCSFYFGYDTDSIMDDNLELKSMSKKEQVYRIFKAMNEKEPTDEELQKIFDDERAGKFKPITLKQIKERELKEMNTLEINADDYTPSKYAEFVRLQNANQKLRKSNFEIQSIDLELLALLNSLDTEVKHSLKALIKSIIAKGGKM